jgi:plasmid maintenance system antidote protein VapI
MEHLVQTRIVTLGAVATMEWLSDVWISRCRSEKDAISLCWAKRNRKGLTVRQAAEELGLPSSHLSNILSGKKYLPHDFRIRFQELCGNWAIRQYEDLRCGFRTEKETPDQRRIRQLEAEVEGLRRTA